MDFCYPPVCAVCLEPAGSGQRLCPECLKHLVELELAGACDRCGYPLASPGAPCPNCLGRGLRPFERVIRLGVHEDPLRGLIHRLKYRGQWGLAELLADRLVDCHEPAKGLLQETDVLVPVPLHPLRQIARGYNQAEVIARRLARRCRAQGLRVAYPAARVRHTAAQVELTSRAQRARNLRDAFELRDPHGIAGKHVVLVDDVMTTGATLRTLARTLVPAKPRSLSVLTLAIADPKGRAFQRV